MDHRLTEALTRRLVLHVCGEVYAFSDASYASGTGRYTWSGAGLDWSLVDSVALAIGGHPGDTQLAVVNPSDTTPPVVDEALANRVRTFGTGFYLGV